MITSVKPMLWKKIAIIAETKGFNWVTSFYVMYTVDGSSWDYYKNKQIFTGNTDRFTLVENEFEAFTAVSIRIYPLTWTNLPCLRLEAYCYEV